jgi:hypothetical protein
MNSPRLNKLRIVFSVNAHVRTRQVLGDTTFDILEGEQTDMQAVFHAIKGVLDHPEKRPVFHTRDGKPISEKRVEERIRKNPKAISYIEIGGVALYANNLTGRRQSFVIVEEKSPGAVSSWDQWVCPFLGWPNFVQAWVADVEYNYWQNAADPLQYTTVGRDMSGLKTKSNGLPYPLEQQIVDTSGNPGRWEFHIGYIEAIGSPMWIGENLWRATGENRESELRALNWLHLTEPQKGVLRAASDFQFTDETTATRQNALRAAIYGSGQQNN